MSEDYQANRQFQVTTPFGASTLLFGRMQAVERLSQPFELSLTLFSEIETLNADLILGKPVVVTVAANATLYYFPEFSVYSLLGFMPTYWSILVYNQSGAAFDLTAANFYAKHSLVSYA